MYYWLSKLFRAVISGKGPRMVQHAPLPNKVVGLQKCNDILINDYSITVNATSPAKLILLKNKSLLIIQLSYK